MQPKAFPVAEKNQNADDVASKTSLDSGVLISAMIWSAIVGGVCTVLTIVCGDTFAALAKSTPLFLVHAVLAAVQGAVAWVGVVPVATTLGDLWRQTEPSARRWLRMAFIPLVLGIGAYIEMINGFSKAEEWGIGESWKLRFMIADMVVLLPGFLAVLAMWAAAVVADKVATGSGPVIERVDMYLRHRTAAYDSLRFLGFILGAVVLATGIQRQAVIAHDPSIHYPSELVAANGGFFTLCIAICFAPAHALLRRAGEHIQRDVLRQTATLEAWARHRKKMSSQLGLDVRVDQALKNAMAVLAPLLATFISRALPLATHAK
jgi:hypothetical protein